MNSYLVFLFLLIFVLHHVSADGTLKSTSRIVLQDHSHVETKKLNIIDLPARLSEQSRNTLSLYTDALKARGDEHTGKIEKLRDYDECDEDFSIAFVVDTSASIFLPLFGGDPENIDLIKDALKDCVDELSGYRVHVSVYSFATYAKQETHGYVYMKKPYAAHILKEVIGSGQNWNGKGSGIRFSEEQHYMLTNWEDAFTKVCESDQKTYYGYDGYDGHENTKRDEIEASSKGDGKGKGKGKGKGGGSGDDDDDDHDHGRDQYQKRPDYIIFITDGDPTTRNNPYDDSKTNLGAALEAAQKLLDKTSYNQYGHKSTKIIAVGVGEGPTEENLRAITLLDDPLLGRDYFLSLDFSAVHDTLKHVLHSMCCAKHRDSCSACKHTYGQHYVREKECKPNDYYYWSVYPHLYTYEYNKKQDYQSPACDAYANKYNENLYNGQYLYVNLNLDKTALVDYVPHVDEKKYKLIIERISVCSALNGTLKEFDSHYPDTTGCATPYVSVQTCILYEHEYNYDSLPVLLLDSRSVTKDHESSDGKDSHSYNVYPKSTCYTTNELDKKKKKHAKDGHDEKTHEEPVHHSEDDDDYAENEHKKKIRKEYDSAFEWIPDAYSDSQTHFKFKVYATSTYAQILRIQWRIVHRDHYHASDGKHHDDDDDDDDDDDEKYEVSKQVYEEAPESVENTPEKVVKRGVLEFSDIKKPKENVGAAEHESSTDGGKHSDTQLRKYKSYRYGKHQGKDHICFLVECPKHQVFNHYTYECEGHHGKHDGHAHVFLYIAIAVLICLLLSGVYGIIIFSRRRERGAYKKKCYEVVSPPPPPTCLPPLQPPVAPRMKPKCPPPSYIPPCAQMEPYIVAAHETITQEEDYDSANENNLENGISANDTEEDQYSIRFLK